MSESLSTLLKDILPQTPGVVRAVARRELIAAVKEFFRESHAWRATLEAVDVTATVSDHTATSPTAEVVVHQVLSVEYMALQLRPVVARPPGDRPTGTPTQWYSTGTNTFSLWPTPEVTEEDSLIVRVALVPLDTIAELPDEVYRRYTDALRDGALGRLFSHPAKPYSDTALAQYHLRRFRDAIGQAAGQGKQGHINGQNWSFPRFGK